MLTAEGKLTENKGKQAQSSKKFLSPSTPLQKFNGDGDF